MKLTRRDFLKASGASVSGMALLGIWSKDDSHGIPRSIPLRKKIGEITSICPYCGVGCGVLMAVEDGRIVTIEGDPDHPVNGGSLDCKGASLLQVANNESRVTKVLYRGSQGSNWEEKDWVWAIDTIARKIKKTRDENWIENNNDGKLVNRVEALASVGSVFPNSEEAYAITKMQRALGMVYIENESRICISSAVAGNTETFGRGPMSNTWIDLGNSDCVLAIGGNIAETFPNAFKWVTRARAKGAKLIHVDPRFTRTSAKSDIYVRIRSGTDIALIGGIIKYVLDDMENNPDNYNMEYIREYTNASFLVNSNYDFHDGLFGGYNEATRVYDKATWQFQTEGGQIKTDKSLQHEDSVFQLLKKHFSRYDADTVCNITGTPKEKFLEACKVFAATGAAGKAGSIVLSSGACESTHGTQNVRCYGILQLLLGNMGISGGGINGVAGAVNGLGGSLQGRLNHWLPGTISPPSDSQPTLVKYVEGGGNKAYMVSLLKAFYSDSASIENDYGFNWLPKRGGDYSWVPLFNAIEAGQIKGLVCWGMNPVVSGANTGFTQEALNKLDWMVVIDLYETETASFWKGPGVQHADINTEIFLLPAASSLEKEGSVTSSARWMQWRYKAVEPPGQAKDDLWIINAIMLRLKELYGQEGGPNAEAITNLIWEYGDPPDVHLVAKEINGYDLTTGKLLSSSVNLKDDGTTACGNWLYCGSYTEAGNMAARRDPTDTTGIGLFPNWAWAWPLNRRIWYNRASVDLDGNPWDPERPVIRWDSNLSQWIGDVADGGWPPVSVSGKYPFIMKTPHGRAHLFGPGMVDGPMPEHYEPWESPVVNPMSSQQFNPVCKLWETYAKSEPDSYPILATTFRVIEHLNTGSFTRNLPWLVELMPQLFVELSEQLAAQKGIKSGDRVMVETARGNVEAVAVITKRIQPLNINGQTVHQIALPCSWGYMGLAKGDSTNVLTPRVADPNSCIPEYRAFLCQIRKP